MGVGNYILKRLLNHRTMRSADVTQGYLHFSADELMEPALRIERAILEHAGIIESKKSLDAKLLLALEGLSEEEKRRLIFDLSQNIKVSEMNRQIELSELISKSFIESTNKMSQDDKLAFYQAILDGNKNVEREILKKYNYTHGDTS
ncbi:Uncharacterised protein [Enterobacter cancerogenus]|uniref:Uncharacterized protein n=1 Tax=Enterobacter cancerogenus TaxID=69218 RepID=A0A484WCK9_9ENTR|nr:Uncharacterised protein [Enterobacter cancerogenus]